MNSRLDPLQAAILRVGPPASRSGQRGPAATIAAALRPTRRRGHPDAAHRPRRRPRLPPVRRADAAARRPAGEFQAGRHRDRDALSAGRPSAARQPGSIAGRRGSCPHSDGAGSDRNLESADVSNPRRQPGRPAAARGERRRRHLRRHTEHPVHEHLLLPLRLLRVLEGQARREPPRPAYLVPLDGDRAPRREAWDRGATEVCLQGGIHPSFDGDYYARSCRRTRPRCRTSTSMRFPPSRCGRARRRSVSRSTDYLAAATRRGALVVAGHGGRDPRRRDPRG